MWKAYINISRVEKADGLLIAQPFAPMLFRQGPLPGPTLLMEFLRGNLKEEDLQRAWEEWDAKKATEDLHMKFVQWRCGLCGIEKTSEHYTRVGTERFLEQYTRQIIAMRGLARLSAVLKQC